ncbi:MAG: ATP-dependent DNA ligase [Candidatus Bathyarchaeia archaeon]
MDYSLITKTYEKIESTTKRLEITDYLVELFNNTQKDIVDKVVYLTQGKLYPDFIGIELGIAERLAIKALSIVSGKKEDEIDQVFKKTGDLGLAAEEILKKKSQLTLFKKSLTVELVYDTFDKIAHATGPGSIESKIRLLCSLLNDATPEEAKYIIRMSIGKLRLGVADMTILDALAIAYCGSKEAREDLERAYNLSSDLGHVAKVVALEGLEGVKKFKISLGRPIRPMLAERLSSPQEILEKMGGKCSLEFKYDGLRVQAHVSKDKAFLFSRRLENITSQFPDVCEYLKEAVKAKEAILEGECVGIEPNTGEMLPFQMISQRRGRKYDIKKMAEEIPVVVFLFDLLYLDGEDLTLKPYLERRKKLEETIIKTEHVGLAEQLIVDNVNKLEEFFETAVSSGCEGLLAKNISDESIYQAGARGWLWIKYKRSYKSEVADTFDLVIVGAFYGKGKRAGSYGALLMATYNPKEDVFETVCKLGSGFTDEDLANFPDIMKDYIIPHKHGRVNSIMEPDIWFVPSIVLEVAADEITLSPLHTCGRGVIKKGSGLALRFPRFTGNWRKDKSPEDATTSKEVIEMYEKQLKKVA